MRFSWFLLLLLCGCVKKITQKTKENSNTISTTHENDVIYITDDLPQINFNDPLFWFCVILLTVFVLNVILMFYKNEH